MENLSIIDSCNDFQPSKNITELIDAIERWKVYTRLYGLNVYLLPLTFISLVLTILYVYLICSLLAEHKKKLIFYTLLLNRAIGDSLMLVIGLMAYSWDLISYWKWGRR